MRKETFRFSMEFIAEIEDPFTTNNFKTLNNQSIPVAIRVLDAMMDNLIEDGTVLKQGVVKCDRLTAPNVCDFCEQYKGRVKTVRDATCRNCVDQIPGHHHHVLDAEPTMTKKQMLAAFNKWLDETHQGR
jgi:hypothetical protein